jgi:hypothetical protein
MSADLCTTRWIKSSYSTNNGTCVELAILADRLAARDSKNPAGPVLTFPAESFRSLVRGWLESNVTFMR